MSNFRRPILLNRDFSTDFPVEVVKVGRRFGIAWSNGFVAAYANKAQAEHHFARMIDARAEALADEIEAQADREARVRAYLAARVERGADQLAFAF